MESSAPLRRAVLGNNVAMQKKNPTSRQPGLVIAAFGKRYDVELEDGTPISCVTRGKKSDLACGDRVEISMTADREGVVEDILPRSSLLVLVSALAGVDLIRAAYAEAVGRRYRFYSYGDAMLIL